MQTNRNVRQGKRRATEPLSSSVNTVAPSFSKPTACSRGC